MSNSGSEQIGGGRQSSLQLHGIDYIEFYVGNACLSSHFFRAIMGFKPMAYCGLETGSKDKVSYVMQQDGIRLVFTSPLRANGPLNEHIGLHGDSVKDVAFSVSDAYRAFDQAIKRGATSVMEPTKYTDDTGDIVKATVATFGHTVHSFIQRTDGKWSLPNYIMKESPVSSSPIGAKSIDHVAIGLMAGELDRWTEFYERVMEFHISHKEDVATECSAMNSQVVTDERGRIKFPMMEPVAYKGKSQIEEYLTFHHGPGVQHIAVTSSDIVSTVRALKSNGIEFLSTPAVYYDTLEERVGHVDYELAALRELNILVDRDEWGMLYQIFTEPLQGRPTLFFEVVERRGARGFGGGNIRALFEAIEREQQLRGTL